MGGEGSRPTVSHSTYLTPEAVLFHPTSENTIVLLSSCKITSTDTDTKHIFTLRLTAQEYTNGNIQTTSFFDIPFISDPKDSYIPMISPSIVATNPLIYSTGVVWSRPVP
jgi:hypothetical protein